ncbi:hypothetical protein AGMMS49950_10900 [Endomicrobiia bacterium]|nr:hypothetical protein AGMMS49950_10900 [Endomicrobiia bacterium]
MVGGEGVDAAAIIAVVGDGIAAGVADAALGGVGVCTGGGGVGSGESKDIHLGGFGGVAGGFGGSESDAGFGDGDGLVVARDGFVEDDGGFDGVGDGVVVGVEDVFGGSGVGDGTVVAGNVGAERHGIDRTVGVGAFGAFDFAGDVKVVVEGRIVAGVVEGRTGVDDFCGGVGSVGGMTVGGASGGFGVGDAGGAGEFDNFCGFDEGVADVAIVEFFDELIELMFFSVCLCFFFCSWCFFNYFCFFSFFCSLCFFYLFYFLWSSSSSVYK